MKRITIFLILILSFGRIAANAQDRLYHNTFNLRDVELLDGPFKHALDLNVKVLLEYDTDRLLAPFLKEAGLTPKAPHFPNWEGLDGHIGGHYVGALAIHYAATGNQECYDRLLYMLSELKRAQDANGDGYIGGVPNSKTLWGELKKGNMDLYRRAWVPWYNVHKLYAGIRDAWQYAGIEEAKDMFLKMCDWGMTIFQDFTDEQMEQMCNTEFGGMNEIFADAYQMTGDIKYLNASKRFCHHQLLDAMASHIDNLDNKHANTQVPKAVGYARVVQQDGDPVFREAAEFFWDRVSNYRSVVIGGNSRSEHFPAKEDYISYIEHREGPESCNTHNMLKLTEFLFAIDPDAKYADFYEKAMYNHILSTQHPEHGGYVYFTSMRPAHYRVYSTVNNGMWCCVGTGMENHGKYGEFIYTHDGASELRVNLFVASRLNWKENKATITQETNFPYEEGSKITVNLKKSKKFKMFIRCPEWTDAGYSIKVNGQEYAAGATPQSYVEIDRKWKNGDVVEISLPMKVKSIGAVVQSPLNIILSLKDKNINSPKDLIGKTVGYSGNALGEAFVKTMVSYVGEDPDAVNLINVGFELMSSMTTDNVDATIGCIVNHEVPQMEEEGFDVNYFMVTDYGIPNYYEAVFLANNEMIENEPEVLAGFLRAAAKGFEDFKADPDGCLEILLENQNEENFPLSRTVEQKSCEILLPLMESADAPFLSQTDENWQENINWMVENGLIEQPIPVSDVVAQIDW